MPIRKDIKKAIDEISGRPILEVIAGNIEIAKKLTNLSEEDKANLIVGYQISLDWITGNKQAVIERGMSLCQ